MKRIGIVGFGHLGAFLVKAVQEAADLELAFVWNLRPQDIDDGLPVLHDLQKVADARPDLIVEVAHPDISRNHATDFLGVADYMAGSPTAFADAGLLERTLAAAKQPNGHGLYIPKGALPGLFDVLQMAEGGKLHSAEISMRKPPHSMRYLGPTEVPLDEITEETVLYDGPLRQLAQWAPNNVNTMCVLALASGLGFDGVQAKFVAVPGLGYHIIDVALHGPPREDGKQFKLELRRTNPAAYGAVTGDATYRSFLGSMQRAGGRGDGLHFC